MRGLVLFLLAPVFSAATPDSCAVLPFANAAKRGASSANPAAAANVDWLGLSIAGTLRDALELRGLVTLGRDDPQGAYHRLGLGWRPVPGVGSAPPLTQASVLKIGETLDAEQVIYGEFEFQPTAGGSSDSRGSLKISARVVDRKHLHESPQFSE